MKFLFRLALPLLLLLPAAAQTSSVDAEVQTELRSGRDALAAHQTPNKSSRLFLQ